MRAATEQDRAGWVNPPARAGYREVSSENTAAWLQGCLDEQGLTMEIRDETTVERLAVLFADVY